jgi:hypothetical protein
LEYGALSSPVFGGHRTQAPALLKALLKE